MDTSGYLAAHHDDLPPQQLEPVVFPDMHIPVNTLLRGDDHRIGPAPSKGLLSALQKADPETIDKLLTVVRIGSADFSRNSPPEDVVRNARLMDTQTLRLVYDRYGDSGLFTLFRAATSQKPHNFELLLTGMTLSMHFIGSDKPQENVLKPDNEQIPAGQALDRYNSNVLLPWLSRELFIPGIRAGWLVSGIGGCRILVSHPFHGIANDTYGIATYATAINAHLAKLGINGATIYFDYLPGLHYDLAGGPAWLAWFSLVATHSDIVIFIKRADTELTRSQRREAEVVSDRVPKKIVTMTAEELAHTAEPKEEIGHKIYIIPGEGMLQGPAGKAKADELEAQITRKYLQRYVDRRGYRPDRLYVQSENRRKPRTYPLGHPMYGHLPLTSDTTQQFGPPDVPPGFEFLVDLVRNFLR